MSILQKLTEGIVHRDVAKEGAALLNKWEKTGLLEGLGDDRRKANMASLLENQAKELLREASSMSAGDVEGFAAVAFPIVRRVFGGLIANDLVSVQPMSLPSGLIFFLDFTKTTDSAGGDAGESIYGGLRHDSDNPLIASQLTGGVRLAGDEAQDPGGFYNLNGGGYSSATGSTDVSHGSVCNLVGPNNSKTSKNGSDNAVVYLDKRITDAQKKLLRFDPDLLGLGASNLASGSATHGAVVVAVPKSSLSSDLDLDNLHAIEVDMTDLIDADSRIFGTGSSQVRRLSRVDPNDSGRILLTFAGPNLGLGTSTTNSQLFVTGGSPWFGDDVGGSNTAVTVKFPIRDSFAASTALGSVVGSELGLEGAGATAGGDAAQLRSGLIPEIDIKVDSVAVTAQTKKLKAKWTPELGQDLNAYHNLDAEVELTGILSEQIALEIDQEILQDLVKGAKAGTYYWSRSPGLFVHRTTGVEIGASSAAPDFTGTVSEWYETLVETINDVSAQIHRKTLRGGANFLVCGPEVANILEFTAGFRASVTADTDRGTVGAVKTGALSKKWDVYVDPYFPRNVVLVGRKGGSFLESGYVYAPYVPLQVTPTIFGQEDFVPRKGVMTRYAKKMVRPDMYGVVVVRDLLGGAGATS